LRSDIDKVIDLYSEKGYATADMRPKIEVKKEKKLVNINLFIIEGDIFRIGKIKISGNTKTRDKVIRREMRLDEGDTYNSKLLKRSYQRITNLNYFETVELNPRPLVREKMIDIDVNVQEKLTGMITIGGGYSSIDKFIATGEINQTNLFGKGLFLRLKADLSAVRTNYNLSITDPWFMDRPISASFSVYNEEFEFPDYDKKATGGSIGFGKELSEYVRGNITYRLEDVEITNIEEGASPIVKDQEGERITSSISPSLLRDSRDNHLDPTRGSKNTIYTTVAGLGGDNNFVKSLFDSLWYFPFKWGTTFSLRGRIGYAKGFSGRDLPLYERFYVGGINTVRGLGFGEAGPRDVNGEVIGGEQELIFNAEFIFPIEKTIRLKGVVFFDAGKSDDSFEDVIDLRTTAGAGVRWMSPFGPIRIEWGYNIDKKFDEGSSKIEFAMGGVF
jgi:outer membrane protein insertion porin family